LTLEGLEIRAGRQVPKKLRNAPMMTYTLTTTDSTGSSYSAVDDFSITANPNNPWSYLYSGQLYSLTYTETGVIAWVSGQVFPHLA
jgi:hypothetical protein